MSKLSNFISAPLGGTLIFHCVCPKTRNSRNLTIRQSEAMEKLLHKYH